MGLQVRGTSVDGGTLVVKTRLSINMASLTLEQVAGKRKKLLADMVVQMAAEVRKDRTAEAAEEAARMVKTNLAPLLEGKPRVRVLRVRLLVCNASATHVIADIQCWDDWGQR